jgi:MFS family permease
MTVDPGGEGRQRPGPDPRLTPVILLEAANLASGVGNAIVMLSIPWLVLEKTGSAASAGLVAAVSALPALLVAPFVGWLVDRFGRRPVSVISDVLSALAVASIPLMAMVGDLTYPTIMALAVLGATFDPAGYTARRSILPDAAEAADRPVDTLNGIHEGIFAIGWTVGPVAGAALIAAVGAAQSFWAPFVLFLIASACVAAMRVGDAGQRARAEAGADGRADRGWTSWTRGFTALWRDRPLRLVTIAVVILAAIYMPTEAVLLPTYFERLGEPGSLGIVISALSLGAMIGAFGYGWLARRLRLATIARLVLAGVALSIVPMALLPPLPVLAAAGFFLGLSWGPADPMMSTLVQTRIPPDEQGRVYGVQMSLFYAAPPIAMLIIGGVVEQLGLPTAYLALALLLAVFSVAALLSPRIRELDRPAPS